MIVFFESVRFKWLFLKFLWLTVKIINLIDRLLQYFGIVLFPLNKTSIFKSLDDELLRETKVSFII